MQETAENFGKDDVPKTQHDWRHEGNEKWDHSSETPFKTHHNQGNNRDKYETGALFVHEEAERQSKHNQKPEERSSQEFDHKEAQMVICCVQLVKEYD